MPQGYFVVTKTFLVLFIEPMEASDIFSSTMDIIIDGDDDLISSDYYSSGGGTRDDPIILNGFPDNTSSIQIKNVSYWISITDQNFSLDHSEYVIDLTNVTGCYLSDLNIINRNRIIYAGEMSDLIIENLTSFCSETSGISTIFFDVSASNDVILSNSTFVTYNIPSQYQYNGCGVISRYLKVSNCNFNNVGLGFGDHYNIRGYFSIDNCVFNNSGIGARNYYPRSTNYITECYFNNSVFDTRQTSVLHFINNTFVNEESRIIFGRINLEPPPFLKYSEIKGNVFESCKALDVIEGYYGSSKVMKGWLISENYFGNCTAPAIDWFENIEEVDDIHVWRNIFYHNFGTGDNLYTDDPFVLDPNTEVTKTVTFAWANGTSYMFKVISAKGNTFVYTATAPAA